MAKQESIRVWFRFREIILCVSLANLALLHVSLSLNSPHHIGFRKTPIDGATQLRGLTAGILAVLLLAAGFWVALRILRRSGGPTAQWVIDASVAFILIVAANTWRVENQLAFPSAAAGGSRAPFAAAIGVGAVLLAGAAIFRWRAAVERAAGAALLCFSVLPAFTAISVLWHVLYPPPAAALADGPLAPMVQRAGGPDRQRIVWMLFDELDQQLLYVRRPVGISLPEFDLLRERSLHAEGVHRPAFMTREAIPSLLFGRAVRAVRDGKPPELLLKFHDSPTFERWNGLPAIFSEARSLGWNAAVVGWYLPYCRVLNGQASACEWEPALSQISTEIPREVPLSKHVRFLLTRTVAYIPLMVRLGLTQPPTPYTAKDRPLQLSEFRAIHDKAMAYLTDTRFTFVFIHWPVPHNPGIFNCKTASIETGERAGDYVDNLCLADRALGEVRATLERAGMWDDTSLLVSSDHSLRNPKQHAGIAAPPSPLIPFLLKLAGDNSAVSYRRPFNAVLSKDLLLNIMRGRVRGNREAAVWLDQNHAHASACSDCGW
jgi:hypothetical protein